MPVFGLLGLFAGLVGVPAFALRPYPARLEFWLCAAAGWFGLVMVPASVEPKLGTAGLVLGPVVLGPWMLAWALAGRARRARTRPGATRRRR